jgi:hypothetical protein
MFATWYSGALGCSCLHFARSVRVIIVAAGDCRLQATEECGKPPFYDIMYLRSRHSSDGATVKYLNN